MNLIFYYVKNIRKPNNNSYKVNQIFKKKLFINY